MAGHKFDENGARRIVHTVRRVENTPYSGGFFAPPMVSSGSSETWLDGKNDSGETIPAYSVVEVKTGSVIDDRYHNYLDQASTTFSRNFGFSVGHDIEDGDLIGFIMEAGWVAYDSSETPAVGDTFGPKPSSWKVWKGYPGFRCVQIKSDEHLMLAVREEVGTLRLKAQAKIAYNATATDALLCIGDSDTPTTVEVSVKNLGADIFTDEIFNAILRGDKWIVEQVAKAIDGTLAGSLSVGNTATLNVDPGSDTVTVQDRFMKTGATAIASGKKLGADWAHLRKEWQAKVAECA